MHLARRFSPVLAALFTLVVAFAVFGAPATPAQAHDALASSDPAPGSVLDAAPSEISLTFTGEILGDGGANAIIVTDASGVQVNDGAPIVDGAVVTQPISTDTGGGTFGVVWRVVSSDGHPISGEFTYSVDAPATAPTVSPSDSPAAPAEPSADASEPVLDGPAEAPLAPSDAGGLGVWGITGIAALVAALIALITVFVRRRAQRGKQS